jgi:hypothetical protein
MHPIGGECVAAFTLSKIAFLSRLRSPAAYADFRKSLKQDAQEAKDLILDQAKSTTESTLQGMVDDLKAKAAANPAATLAIGAGIAWRLSWVVPVHDVSFRAEGGKARC